MKEIKWNAEEIRILRKGHVYNDMSEEIKIAAEHLAEMNAIDICTAKIIILMLMNCSAYTAVNVSNTKIEFKFNSENADIINEDCIVTCYVCKKRVSRTELKNYINSLFGYLR